MLISLLLTSLAAADATPEIVVTASRAPEERSKSAASTTVRDQEQIERLGDPLAVSLLRLVPSAAVETSGPAGSFAEVRIRGAEANHTLLFIDGIRANDPAANDTPRFELLNSDMISRIEVVRGPQSALWGSDAIGGVIAVNGLAPTEPGYSAAGEAGSFGFRRLSASGQLVSSNATLAGAIGWQRATGIDSFNGEGDRDGYRNLSGRIRGSWEFAPGFEVGAAAFSLDGRSEFDGFNPDPPFQHTDTLDNTRNRLSAGRLWLKGGDEVSGLSGSIATSLLGSSNRNFIGNGEINRTAGDRWTVNGQLEYRFSTGPVRHTAIVALDHDRETFEASDIIFFNASDQHRHRSHDAVTAEWRAELKPLVADIAVRRDSFSAFADATTVRASALFAVGGGFSIAASYSEGIAQPTFFDLFGVFPGTFIGNPSLKPESSRGFEASLRFRRGPIDAAVTGYKQTLHDEIIDLFDPATFTSTTANRSTSSHRSGIEAEFGWKLGKQLRLSATYAYLHATEPGAIPSSQLREVRRPKHSGSLALDGASGRLTYGGSVAYVGTRSDTNFDVFPAQKVRLKAYWLAGGRVAYPVRPGVELFARVSNLFDAKYQDVVGYRTEGRAVFAGVRLGGR
ncbi:TonB-dependent receptor [Sphingomonas sp. RG327]|uniref:TonB-dependent receptor n=1 Tax=Sphingomonas anseongensis TaxID=2908207 RepID=A0ABT0RE65_9SPHN|nr:TonB-dependent receptor [Sphingomonas anseongensis]MCL6678215.1 TonB-dependent receptor [Sphingomonas anseongensis]